jgi:hypothetical protein
VGYSLARWLVGKHVLHSDDDVAHTWGVITAHAYLRGRPRPTNDSWIAACCLAYDSHWSPRTAKTSKTSLSTKVCAYSVASWPMLPWSASITTGTRATQRPPVSENGPTRLRRVGPFVGRGQFELGQREPLW